MSIANRFGAAIAAAALLLLAGGAPASAQQAGVALVGAAQVPPVETAATGIALIAVGEDGAVSGRIETRGIGQIIAVHVHAGAPGTNGPVVITLDKSSDGNIWTIPDGARLADADYRAYLAGHLYINVHSDEYKAGELRGQLKP
jgi:hypothetical protein